MGRPKATDGTEDLSQNLLLKLDDETIAEVNRITETAVTGVLNVRVSRTQVAIALLKLGIETHRKRMQKRTTDASSEGGGK